MKFAVITHIEHKERASTYFAYEPYVREMNLWFQHVDEVGVVGALTTKSIAPIDTAYKHSNLSLYRIPSIAITSFLNILRTLLYSPLIAFKIFKVMLWADHIHLRCPSNIGLMAAIIQVFFPRKSKTVKYAGNWDPNSKQPWSYRLQKRILSNSFFTRNTQVLVYGKWPNQTQNVLPFFTASYSEREIQNLEDRDFSSTINLIYVGGLTEGKQPLKSIQGVQKLLENGIPVVLDMYGEGPEQQTLENYIAKHELGAYINLKGNVEKDQIKSAFQKAHFLVFLSKSEGWPKVVAEAMFWGCLPITSAISCVPYMVDHGGRGALVQDDGSSICKAIMTYLEDPKAYHNQSKKAMQWSQKFTLEKFDSEIEKLLKH